MSREDVIRRIVERDIRRQGLSEELVAAEVPELHASACELFGAWDTALRYAGISRRRFSRSKLTSAAKVIRSLQRLAADGLDLSARTNKDRDRGLYDAARRHFGKWRKALIAAGISGESKSPPVPPAPPPKLTGPQMIEALKQRHAKGQPISRAAIQRDDHELARAALGFFKLWNRFLEAAGIPPARIRKRNEWNQEKVLAAIRQRALEGKPLRRFQVVVEQNRLVNAARRYYPTWTDAVAAALQEAPGSDTPSQPINP